MTLNLISPGEFAPDFELENIHGNLVQLSDYRGRKPIVLAFLRGFL
jgi:peroxiredoxin